MLILLKDITDEGLAIDERLSPSQLVDDFGESLLDGPLRLSARADPEEGRVALRGRLTGRLALLCCRCLERFPREIDLPVELKLVGDAVEFGAAEAEFQPEDASLVYADEGRIDLGAVATELTYLDLPLKPLCRADCAGLCPTCGANRNRLECGCPREVPDLRLAPLLEIKDKLGGS